MKQPLEISKLPTAFSSEMAEEGSAAKSRKVGPDKLRGGQNTSLKTVSDVLRF